MHLRKTLTIGVAVLAAALLCLTATATATTLTGGAPAFTRVNGTSTTGSVAIDGIFKSGNATFLGSTYGCTGGSIAGTVKRGAITPGQVDLSFTTANITCATPTGNANVTLQTNCSVDLKFPDTPTAKDPNPIAANVHDGTVDTSAYPIPAASKFNLVRGTVTAPTTPAPACVKVSTIGGFCTAYSFATIPAYFNESIKTVGGVSYQDVIIDGPGTLTGQTAGCFGAMAGTYTLNQFTFNVRVTGGTTTGIDFRLTP